MKILALSLLRLGDLLMHQDVLKSLETVYPNADIDIAVNDSTAGASVLIDARYQLRIFNRQRLQDNLVRTDLSFFSAFADLQEWAKDIQASDYDYLVDLTHNRLSRALVELLNIEEIRSETKTFLNDIFSDSKGSTFHYVDALHLHLGLLDLPRVASVKEAAAGQIVIQPMTSDLKKTWSLASWKELIGLIAAKHPDKQIVIVGSPSESFVLESQFINVNSLCRVEICDLLQLKKIIEQAEILVSCDTASLHLATMTGTKSLSLFLGSADATKTGPRVLGSIVLQSVESCAPCRHSESCFRETHACSSAMNSKHVFEVLETILGNGDIRQVAWQMPFEVFKVSQNSLGRWFLDNLTDTEGSIFQQIRQLSFLKIYNGQAVHIEHLMKSHAGEDWELSLSLNERMHRIRSVIAMLSDFQDEVRAMSKSCLRLELSLDEHLNKMVPLIRDFTLLAEDSEWSSVLKAARLLSINIPSFTIYRRWKNTVESLYSYYHIQYQILNSMQNLLRERGVYYVPGPSRTT